MDSGAQAQEIMTQQAGLIVIYYGKVDDSTFPLPPGWLLCDGSPIPSGNQYDDLRNFMQGHHGTTNTPDLRGVFIRGAGQNSSSGVGNSGDVSRGVGSPERDALQNHQHIVFQPTRDTYVQGGGRIKVDSGRQNIDTNWVKSPGNNNTRVADETRPANIAINYLIKT